jgi:uncharacterized LabA/DUF88 family protein
MRRYAVLIDAGFVKRKLGSQANPIDEAVLQRFVARLVGHEALRACMLHRIYYYDAPPLTNKVDRPLRGGTVDFAKSPLAKHNTALLHGLAKLPFFSIRLGDLDFRGWSISNRTLRADAEHIEISADDLRPLVKQTGVDMRIGLDIASLTLKKHVDLLVLVTGDSDFVPAMKFARREGAQLFLVTFGHSVKDSLHEHADLLLEFAAAEFIETVRAGSP